MTTAAEARLAAEAWGRSALEWVRRGHPLFASWAAREAARLAREAIYLELRER